MYQRGTDQVLPNDRPVSRGTGKIPKNQKSERQFSRSDKPKINEGRHARYQAETGQVSRRDRPSIKEAEPKFPTRTGSSFISRTGQKYQRGTGQVSQNDRPVSRGTGKIPKIEKQFFKE